VTLQQPFFGLCTCGKSLTSSYVQHCGDCFGRLAHIWNGNRALQRKIFRDPVFLINRYRRANSVNRTCHECNHTTWSESIENCNCPISYLPCWKSLTIRRRWFHLLPFVLSIRYNYDFRVYLMYIIKGSISRGCLS
jgi:hypothetical protein